MVSLDEVRWRRDDGDVLVNILKINRPVNRIHPILRDEVCERSIGASEDVAKVITYDELLISEVGCNAPIGASQPVFFPRYIRLHRFEMPKFRTRVGL